jgi:hypothetical protein
MLNAALGSDQSVTVLGMPEYENDPAGNTQQFRAFQRGAAEPAAKGGNTGLNTGLIVGVAAVVVIVAVVAALAVVVL